MRILISGAGGLIGSRLSSFLKSQGNSVFKLVRRESSADDEIVWNIEDGFLPYEKIERFDAVIHLAGENIGEGRWTKKKKQRIVSSRVEGTRLLAESLAGLKHPPKVLIVASAVGIYGDRKDEILTEESKAGTGFLADVCSKWEAAAEPASKAGIRVVNTRFGVVFAPQARLIVMLKKLFKMNLGGTIGSGKQYMSWIALEDLMRAILFILKNKEIKGAVNLVSPHPITNIEFTKSLSKVLRKRAFLRIPSFTVKLLFGEKGKEMMLSSVRVSPAKLIDSGFKFDYEKPYDALKVIITKGK